MATDFSIVTIRSSLHRENKIEELVVNTSNEKNEKQYWCIFTFLWTEGKIHFIFHTKDQIEVISEGQTDIYIMNNITQKMFKDLPLQNESNKLTKFALNRKCTGKLIIIIIWHWMLMYL